MKYEIHIGQITNIDTMTKEPKNKITISKEQLDIIKLFSDVKKDKELNDIFQLNNINFTIVPKIFDDTDKIYNDAIRTMADNISFQQALKTVKRNLKYNKELYQIYKDKIANNIKHLKPKQFRIIDNYQWAKERAKMFLDILIKD